MRGLIALPLLFAAFSLSFAASPSAGTGKTTAKEADHAALRLLRQKVTDALSKRDVEALSSCLADPFVFTAVDQTRMTSVADIEKFYKKMFDGPKAIVKSMKCEISADVPTVFLDDETGYCYGTNKETYVMSDGRTVVMNTKWTAVLVKRNGEWKIAAAQSGVDFTDNPLLSYVTGMFRKMALFAFVVGIALGAAVLVFARKLKGSPGKRKAEEPANESTA